MEVERYEHGVPSWVDLSTPDTNAAAAFYSALFGWGVDEGAPEAGGYRMCMLRAKAVAGLGPQQNPGPPVWNTYVNVDDADDVAARVTAAGGQVLAPPLDVMTFGRMAVFADPAGAAIAVWQPGLLPGAGLVNEPGALCWNELLTTDTAAAVAFYPAVFGWQADHQGPADAAAGYTEWKVNGRTVAGMRAKPAEMPADVPSHWSVCFAVDDADAAVAKVAELGGSVVIPPTDIEFGRFAGVIDPAGAAFSVIALAPGVAT